MHPFYADKKIRVHPGLKCTFFTGNFLFLALGVFLIVQGASSWNTPLFQITSAKLMILLGSLVSIVSFLGCCGAWAENRFILSLYFIVLFFTLLAEVGVGVGVYYLQKSGKAESIPESYWDKTPDKVKKEIQDTLGCCGFFNTTDNPFLPCPVNATNGCEQLVVDTWHHMLEHIYRDLFIAFGVQLLGVILACVMFSSISNKKISQRASEALLYEAHQANRNFV